MSVASSKLPKNGLKNDAGNWSLGETTRTPLPQPTRKAQPILPWLLTMFLVTGIMVALLVFSLKHGKPPSTHQMTTAVISGTGIIPLAAQTATSPVSHADQTNLLFMREEEKMARDLYVEMHRLWGASVFRSIAGEKQEHMDAMARLLTRYQLPDPVGADVPGKYLNTALATLYQTLMQQGKQSLDEALRASALQEEIIILDLDVSMKATTQTDIKGVYSELLRDSYNHLRAFVHGLELRGTPYQGSRLPQTTIDAIVHGPTNQGFVLRQPAK